MSLETQIIIILAVCVTILFFLWRRASQRLTEVHFQKRSLSSKYGKMTEQFLPFLADYPYDPQNFRFLGTPIDGVQFNDNEIVFLEFKVADSQLSQKQRAIRDLIKDRRVSFEELRLR